MPREAARWFLDKVGPQAQAREPFSSSKLVNGCTSSLVLGLSTPPALPHLTCLACFGRWQGVGTVVITLGERGAYAARRLPPSGSGEAAGSEGMEEFEQPCVPIEVRDTTGAGDAFCAGFAFALLQSQGDVRQAVRWGCAMGRAVVGCYGASTLPERAAILEGLGKGGIEAS